MPSAYTKPYVSRGTFVPGEGPVPCDLMLIGEGPGAEEDKYGRPWVGKAGRELWRYLFQSTHRTRTSVYATNLVKYRVPEDGDPTPDDIARDAPILAQEVQDVAPEIIVCLGRWSVRRFLGDVDMEVCHGIPRLVGHRCIMPIIHPAAGLHSTEFQGTIAWDFEQLAKLLRGEIEPYGEGGPVDERPNTDYFEADGFTMIADAAVDTEGSVRKPWCVSFTGTPGMACCNRIGGVDFRHIVLHNALHDIGVLRATNCSYDTFDDTMIKAYLLCVEPQGLKALAKRHCGMEMSSYDELVAHANRMKAHQYLRKVLGWLNKQSIKEQSASSTTSSRSRKRTSGRGGRKSSRMRPKGMIKSRRP